MRAKKTQKKLMFFCISLRSFADELNRQKKGCLKNAGNSNHIYIRPMPNIPARAIQCGKTKNLRIFQVFLFFPKHSKLQIEKSARIKRPSVRVRRSPEGFCPAKLQSVLAAHEPVKKGIPVGHGNRFYSISKKSLAHIL